MSLLVATATTTTLSTSVLLSDHPGACWRCCSWQARLRLVLFPKTEICPDLTFLVRPFFFPQFAAAFVFLPFAHIPPLFNHFRAYGLHPPVRYGRVFRTLQHGGMRHIRKRREAPARRWKSCLHSYAGRLWRVVAVSGREPQSDSSGWFPLIFHLKEELKLKLDIRHIWVGNFVNVQGYRPTFANSICSMLSNLHALILPMVSSAVVCPLIQKCEHRKTFEPIQPVGHLEPLVRRSRNKFSG